MNEHRTAAPSTSTDADAVVSRARWTALTPTQRAVAVHRRERLQRRRRRPVLALTATAVLVIWLGAGAVLSAVTASALWQLLTFLAGIALLIAVASLAGTTRAINADEALPDVIPPDDDTSVLSSRAGRLRGTPLAVVPVVAWAVTAALDARDGISDPWPPAPSAR